VCWYAKKNPIGIANAVSWSTLALVAGLFVLVDAVQSVGALRYTEAALAWAERLPTLAGALAAAMTVGLANNAMNNLPAGLLAGATIAGVHAHGLLVHAVLLGIDLGPNLSITGSLATILWLLALRKGGVKVSFFDFLKVGALAMPAALVCAVAGVWVSDWMAKIL
jgi:arsenical pump membrane protein